MLQKSLTSSHRRTYATWGHRLYHRAVFLCGDHTLTAFCPLAEQPQTQQKGFYMAFFNSAVDVLQTLVVALGAGLGIWGVINLMEGYGNDNPGAKSQGMKQLMAGGGVALIGMTLVPLLSGLFG